MIRMGRKPEQPSRNESATEFSNSNPNYNYQPSEVSPYRSAPNEPVTASAVSPNGMRAMTDSESMARDIKEGRLSGFVGTGTVLSGETNFTAMLRVDGHLTGRVQSESGTLIVGTGGVVDANVSVASAIVHGTVNGDIVATERVEFGRTAKVVGNIQTPNVMIEQGAVFEGNCSMVRQKAEMEKRHAAKQNNNFASNYESTEPTVETAPETVVETAAV